MRNLHRLLFAPLISAIIISGCSASSGEKDEKTAKTEVQKETADTEQASGNAEELSALDSPPLPKTLEEIITYPEGSFSSDDLSIDTAEVEAALDAVPEVPEDASDEELKEIFGYLYSQFKKEYQDPRAIMESATEVKGPDSESSSSQESQASFNVEIVLDSSGSMANKLGSKTRMELAKESIKKFASSLPEEANISLRVYGHKGTGSDSDKKMSCSSNELVYSPQPYNEGGLDSALDQFNPAGWTPLAQSLIEAQKDLAQFEGQDNKNMVYVVSDGIETCDGNPIEAAKDLKDSGVAPVVNIIGFDVKGKDQKQLEEVAKAAGGTYQNVTSQQQLQDQLDKAVEESMKWRTWYYEERTKYQKDFNYQKLDIRSIKNEWVKNHNIEKSKITMSLSQIKQNGKITDEQLSQITDFRDEYYKRQREVIDELTKVLIDVNEADKENIRKQLDELYEKNVSN
ncbi:MULTISPECIES: VWA domain-containing protein [Bacillaceae]|uniref:VWA domain-containing protein n=1 Tax=Bacillaceae TaxID=186817 RepID=UPI002963CC43|nr:VWA domain-containing protein [Bacillus infantis]MDW2879570.1 VWA domain-containing protein [Bacillus infantis]